MSVESATAPPEPQAGHVALDIPVENIHRNPFNDRAMGDLSGLTASILRDGVLQAGTVCTTEAFLEAHPQFADDPEYPELPFSEYVLIFGERRWRASIAAKAETYPAVVRDELAPITDLQRAQFSENFHRKQATPIEEARQFRRWADSGWSYQTIADELGCAKSHVSRRLALLKLPEELQQAVDEEKLGPDTARLLMELPDPEQQVAAWHVIRDSNADVAHAKAAVLTGPHRAPTPAVAPAPSSGAPAVERTAAPVLPAPRERLLPADDDDHQRATAAADRQEACKAWLVVHSPDQAHGIVAAALLTPIQQSLAHTLAHSWLRSAGLHKLDVAPPSAPAYFDAVADSGDLELIDLAVFAVALAAAELRAASKRRPVWDSRDRAYVQALQRHAGYVPETDWEKRQLAAHT
jgi:ParB/RepB/Spo0J family partition protein